MGTIRRQLLLNLLKLFDLALMIFAFGFATVVVSHASMASLEEVLAMRVKIQNFVIFSGLLFCWHMIFSMCGLYASHRLSSRKDEVLDLARPSSVGTFVMFLGPLPVSHHALITSEVPRRVLGERRIGRDDQPRHPATVSGAGPHARAQSARHDDRGHQRPRAAVCQQDQRKSGAGLSHRGVRRSRTERGSGASRVRDSFGSLISPGLPSFLRTNVVDEVVIALPDALHALRGVGGGGALRRAGDSDPLRVEPV